MLNKKLFASFFAVICLVTACKDDEVVPGDGLIARAGADQQVKLGDNVTVDGSASTESGGKPFDYSWALTKRPAGSAVTLTTPKMVKASFVPDEEGEYELELTISNSEGKSTDKLLVTAAPAEPETLAADIKAKTVLINRISNPNFPDYVVSKTIGVNAELIINPGVVIAFARDTRFEINDQGGVLIAKGEAGKKIRLEGREKTKGFWGGLIIKSASGGNTMEHIEISHAGSKALIGTLKGGMLLTGSTRAQMAIKNCTFSGNQGYGLVVQEQSVLTGFAVNSFKENSDAGILINGNNVGALDENSVFTGGNGRNVIEIPASEIAGNATTEVQWAVSKDNTPYRFVGNVGVRGNWKVLPGTILEFERDIALRVDAGYMNAIGNKDKKIIMRGAEPAPGYWRGVFFGTTSSKNLIEYADISGGGSIAMVSGVKANISIHGTDARMEVKNSVVSKSGGYGIYVAYHTIVNQDIETSNTFKENIEGNYYKQK